MYIYYMSNGNGDSKAVKEHALEKLPDSPVKSGVELGFYDSAIYSPSHFGAYNPDELLYNKGVGVYAKMKNDDQVKAVLEFKTQAVASRNFFFDIDEENKQHEEMALFFEAMLKNVKGSFRDSLKFILSALDNGYSITEKVYATFEYEGKQMWGVKAFKLRPYETFVFDIDVHGNILKVEQEAGSRRIEIPLHKIIHFVHQPQIDEIYGRSDLRACYRDWWSKDNIIKFRNIHLERHASGWVWASVNSALSTENETALKSFFNSMSTGLGAIFPEGIDINHVMPTKTDAFEKAIAACDKAIAKSMLVPNLLGLSEQGNTGSFAQSQTQFDMFMFVLDDIAARLEEDLNEQVFRPIALWNYGTADFPRFKFSPVSDAARNEMLTIWGDLISKSAVVRTEADETHIRNLMEFPQKPEEEEVPEVPPEDQDVIPAEGDIEDEIEDELPDQTEFIASLSEHQLKHWKQDYAEMPWMKRVDFKEINNDMETGQEKYTNDLLPPLADTTVWLDKEVRKMWGDKSGTNVNANLVVTLEIPKKIKAELRRENRKNLQLNLNNGFGTAKSELPKKEFAKPSRIPPGMDKVSAEKYLSSRSFTITGDLTNDILKAAQNSLQNSIKYDRSLAQTIQALKDDAKLQSMLPKVDNAGRAVNTPFRIETIARTSITDSFNQGRQLLFEDPDLGGFVEAFQYSAVLDDATTDICAQLDGKILTDFAEYLPPNHFNCRSLLIPVTTVDDWNGKQSSQPTLKPQEGFG
jgi:SPP1 gp7 family putative phage head morphogenesis protein